MYNKNVSSISFNAENYSQFGEDAEEEMWKDIATTLRILTTNGQICTFEYEDCGYYFIQHGNEKEVEWGGLYPYWISADDYDSVRNQGEENCDDADS